MGVTKQGMQKTHWGKYLPKLIKVCSTNSIK